LHAKVGNSARDKNELTKCPESKELSSHFFIRWFTFPRTLSPPPPTFEFFLIKWLFPPLAVKNSSFLISSSSTFAPRTSHPSPSHNHRSISLRPSPHPSLCLTLLTPPTPRSTSLATLLCLVRTRVLAPSLARPLFVCTRFLYFFYFGFQTLSLE